MKNKSQIHIRSIATVLIVLSSSVTAVNSTTDDDVVKICNKAKDYWSCVRAMSGKQPELRAFGPLLIDWSVWRVMNGSYVAPSYNSSREGFYLAINCSEGKINVSNKKGSWRGWITPVKNFEYNFIETLCKEKNTPTKIGRDR